MALAVQLAVFLAMAPASGPSEANRPAPRRDGTGMAIAAGVLGAAGLALNVTRATTFALDCQRSGYNYDDGCFGAIGPWGYTAMFGIAATTANVTAMGLAFGAGRRRGQTSGPGDRRQRRRAIVAGSVLLGLGIAVQVMGFGLTLQPSLRDPGNIDDDGSGDRMKGLYVGGVAAAQAGAMIGGAGAWLLGNGLARRERGSQVRVGVAPGGLVMRF